MYNALNAILPQGGRYKSLAQIGLKVGDGGKLDFDSDVFNQAFATDPDAVQKLFTFMETTTNADGTTKSTGKGLGYVLGNAITKLIDPADGTITMENQTLDAQTQQYNGRITQLNALLDQKRSRLELQFANMESVLSQLQSQQSSLSQIKALSTMSSSSSS
jgi:flagellar hook-associated protein 2